MGSRKKRNHPLKRMTILKIAFFAHLTCNGILPQREGMQLFQLIPFFRLPHGNEVLYFQSVNRNIYVI